MDKLGRQLGFLILAACVTDDSDRPRDDDADADGYSRAVDCDDQDASIHPRAEERCDGVDNDCDWYQYDVSQSRFSTHGGWASGGLVAGQSFRIQPAPPWW